MEAKISALRQLDTLTIIGFGSLMSAASARSTFATLGNFRVVRLRNFRRVFRHPAAVFFERGIADLGQKTMSSLCAERVLVSAAGATGATAGSVGFTAVAFDVKPADVDLHAFFLREEEFSLEFVPFTEVQAKEGDDGGGGGGGGGGTGVQTKATGLMCLASSDEAFKQKWGEDVFECKYRAHGLDTIWGWDENSGILPCSVYLRHCVLAVNKPEFPASLRDSFLDETWLADRKTTVRMYLNTHPEVMECKPPPSLAARYSG
jgi:hypothetical protein